MNIAIAPHELSDEELLAFLAELHAIRWHEIHPSNHGIMTCLLEESRAEIARRVFAPWWKPEYTWDFVPGYGRIGANP